MTLHELVFFLVAALAILAALAVILHPHPVYSALALVVALFQIAVLFLLLGAQMIAFLQVLVYAGAIMVLFLFVIMLLNMQREPAAIPAAWKVTTLLTGGLLAGELTVFFLGHPLRAAAAGDLGAEYGSVTALGRALFTDHALSFEITSILLLVAVVGSVVLARKGAD